MTSDKLLSQFYTETKKPDEVAKWKKERDSIVADKKKQQEDMKTYIEAKP